MRSDGLITDQEFLAQKSVLSDRRMALENAAPPERISADQVREHLGEIREPLSHPKETWETLPGPFRRRFNRLIVPVGFVAGESRTAELGLLFRALGDLREGNTTVGSLAGGQSNRLLQEIQAFAELFRDYFEFKKESEKVVRRNPRE